MSEFDSCISSQTKPHTKPTGKIHLNCGLRQGSLKIGRPQLRRLKFAAAHNNESTGSGLGASSDNRPIEVPSHGYVGSDACRSCRTHHHKTWHASYHRTMTQVPTPENVVADFNNVTLQTHGKTYQLTKDGDLFFAEMDDPKRSSATVPPTAYGLLKAAHSHTIEIPSVAAGLASGRPNGCNMCHLDQSLDWTSRHLEDWYGIGAVEMAQTTQAKGPIGRPARTHS